MDHRKFAYNADTTQFQLPDGAGAWGHSNYITPEGTQVTQHVGSQTAPPGPSPFA